jgi:uncharacterized Zn finger protein
MHCKECGGNMKEIDATDDSKYGSYYLVCKNCHTLWNIILNTNSMNDKVINVNQYLEELREKKLAS